MYYNDSIPTVDALSKRSTVITLREFLENLEKEGVPVNWDSAVFREYLREKYE